MVTLYTIHADDVPVYLPPDMWDEGYEEEQITPTSANLVMEDNKSGSFVFSILPQHPVYDEIDLIRTTIKVTEHVYDDDGSLDSEKILWKGRAISVEDDMDGVRTFTCEGALAFLNDIICYPSTNAIVSDVVTADDGYYTAKEMRNAALKQALQDYLDDGGVSFGSAGEGVIFSRSPIKTNEFGSCIYSVGRGYNEMCDSGRTFRVGKITVGNNRGIAGFIDATEANDGAYSPDDYPDGAWMFKGELTTPTAAFASALDQILNITVEQNGGHLRVRHEDVNGKERMYLDYLGDFEDTDASAEYGVNIIEFGGKIELNSPVTDIIPRGAVISTWNGNETVDDAIDTSRIKIDDVVYFTGNYHYVASTSDLGYKCTAGSARVTNLNYGAKHPIHLIHTGNDSTVYGWVNQSDIGGNKDLDTEFVGRHYDSYPYTEYIGIANNGYDGGVPVVNESLMSKYGRIQQIVDFPDISDPTELKEAAEEWLEAHSSFLKQTYEISLVDLGHVYGSGETPIHLLDRIHVSMPNHDIDEYMPVTKIELDLLNPANTTISFSRETNRSTVSRARSRAAAAVIDPSVQLNQPNDSISQSLARNIQYISETSNHATINTSVTQNMKVTLPGGETGNFDLVASGTNTVAKLTFVNGLLCTAGKAGGPEYNFFTYKFIHGPSILKPPARYACIRYGWPSGGSMVGNPHKGSPETFAMLAPKDLLPLKIDEQGLHSLPLYMVPPHPSSGASAGMLIPDKDDMREWLGFHNIENFTHKGTLQDLADLRQRRIEEFGYDDVGPAPSVGYYTQWVPVEPYPNFFSDSEEADELILNDQYGSKEYGLYYRLVNGERKYFMTPCIYYLPNNYTGDLYCFYAGPLTEITGEYRVIVSQGLSAEYPYSWEHKGDIYGDPTGQGQTVILGRKISNLGTLESKKNVRTQLLREVDYDINGRKMVNDLKIMSRENLPSYTDGSSMVKMSNGYSYKPVGIALLMMPRISYTSEDTTSSDHGDLFVCPAIIQESEDYSYIDGARRPKRIKIYSGHGSEAVPINFKSSTNIYGSPVYMTDMSLKEYYVHSKNVKTNITTSKYYVFSKEEDLLACIEDYKSGQYSQYDIEARYRSKIIAIDNTYNTDEKQSKVYISYDFNGKGSSYYVSGSGYTPFY